MKSESLYAKWTDWLKRIDGDVTALLIVRDIYYEVRKIIESNADIQTANGFYEWMGHVYAAYALMAVRRQVDGDKRNVSLARLLREIRDNPTVLSRDRFRELYRRSALPQQSAHMRFDKLAGPGKSHILTSGVKDDIGRLRCSAECLRNFINKRLAHFDRKGPATVPTFAELDDCIDLMETLLRKYLEVFRGSVAETLLPVYQNDWKQVFMKPWIVEERWTERPLSPSE